MRYKHILLAFLVLSTILLWSQQALAGSATVSWNASTDNVGVVGYKIYYGTSPRTGTCPTGGYPNVQNAGNVLSYAFNNLTDGSTYYFSVTAYDAAGNESCFSTEVSKAMPAASYCDINKDGQTSILDLQKLTNVVLGVSSCTATSCDVNKDGQVNVLDTQTLVNVILGIRSCP